MGRCDGDHLLFEWLRCPNSGLTATKAAQLFVDNCVAVMGLPNDILSDNDHLITSKFFTRLCELTGIEQHSAILHRPRGNGRAENAVRMVIEILRRSLTQLRQPWITALPWALFQLNDLPGVTQRHAPHKLVFGRDPVSMGDIPALCVSREVPEAEQWFKQMDALRLEAKNTAKKTHQTQTERFRRRHTEPVYQPGDRV